jgi:hypothetical protein
MFEDHLLKWGTQLVGATRLDACFKSMPRAEGIRHFPDGISGVTMWTGAECREMQKVLLPILVDTVDEGIVIAAHAIIDFSYLAHMAAMTNFDLEELNGALQTFHQHKSALITAGIMSQKSFDDIPKLHMLSHYAFSIRQLGTPDGYSTESPEHLHIEFAKEPWRKSNKKVLLPQMIKFVRRQHALEIHRTKLEEYYGLMVQTRVGKKPARNDEDWGDIEGGSDSNEGWEDVDDESAVDSGVTYPYPTIAIVQRPTRTRLRASWIANEYGATDLIPVLQRLMRSQLGADQATAHQLALPNSDSIDLFKVWHRFRLFHRRLPFAPREARKRDVVRARPPEHEEGSGDLLQPGIFDTVLLLDSLDKFGIHRKSILVC